jgi:ATP-binding cassette, subfamily B, bacterial
MRSPRHLIGYLRPHTTAFVVAAFAMAARSAAIIAAPWPLKFIIDSVILRRPLPPWLAPLLPDPAHHRLAILNVLGFVAIVLGLVDPLLEYLGTRPVLAAGQRAIFEVRRDLFMHVQRLSLSFHRRQKTGELLTRFGGDIQTLQEFVSALGSGFFAQILTIVGIIVVMVWTDWHFAVVSLSVIPLLLVLSKHYTTRLKRSMRLARRKEGALWGSVQEILASVHLVQAYGRESYEDERFTGQAGESLNAALEAGELQLRFGPLVGGLMAISLGVALWYGASRVLAGNITTGELLVFLAYLRALSTPVRQIAKVAGVVGKATVASERLAELFAQEPEICDAAGAFLPQVCRGALEFRDVWYRYGSHEPVLREISLKVEPGETVAFVGPTGAGKSTLLSLVPRFHDPQQGHVLLDGHDLRQLSLAFVRAQVALVLQDSLVFQGTVWENIAYGRPGANRRDAIEAARAVGVHDIVESLPDGYDTMIAERGVTLSGGQRQCVSIARAMLRDARIVLLDEPTSGLDAISERHVMQAMRRLSEGRTTLIIAHRLSTVREADRILVVNDGRIVEVGQHDALYALRGAYFRLWTAHDRKELSS